jgi:hypothetical protein
LKPRHRPPRGAVLVFAAVCVAVASRSAVPAFGQPGDSAPSAPAGTAEQFALVIAEGSVAQRELVALGRDLWVAGEARSDVAVLRGNARIDGSVEGSVIVLSGNVALGPRARVARDVYVLGGRLDAAPGASVGGRAASYPTASAVFLTLLEGPSLGAAAASAVLAAKLALLVAWAIALVLALALRRRELLATSASVAREPFRNFFVGLGVVTTAALVAVLVAAGLSAVLGAPVVALVALFALALKIVGLVAVFHALGDWLLAHWPGPPRAGRGAGSWRPQRSWLAIHAGTVGLVVLGVVKLVPVAGTLVWTVASLIGVGAAAVTKLGRNEPWLADSL